MKRCNVNLDPYAVTGTYDPCGVPASESVDVGERSYLVCHRHAAELREEQGEEEEL